MVCGFLRVVWGVLWIWCGWCFGVGDDFADLVGFWVFATGVGWYNIVFPGRVVLLGFLWVLGTVV